MEKSTQIAELKAELDRLAKKVADLEKQPELTAKERWEKDYDSLVMGYSEERILSAVTKESFNLWMHQFNLMTELQTFAKLRNGDWVADWENDNEKFGVSVSRGKAKADYWGLLNGFVYGISFKSEKIAQEALEIFGERIEQFYGK